MPSQTLNSYQWTAVSLTAYSSKVQYRYMPSSESGTDNSSTKARSPLTKRRIVLLALSLSLITVWYARYRGTGWTNLINPMYWIHRARGDDLYRSDVALLLHGNRDLPEVALTFDDGPHPESRALILDILHREQIHATFFDVGINMAAHPDLVRRTLDEGSEIGNHSEDHRSRLDT